MYISLPCFQRMFVSIKLLGEKRKDEIEFKGIIWKKYSNSEVNLGKLLILFKELEENVRSNYVENDEMNPFSKLIKY